MRGARNLPQEPADIITQHLAKLQIAADCTTSDAHGASPPATAFAEDKTSNKGWLELLRINLAIARLFEEESANDMDPLPSRRVRQTTDIAHEAIEGRQLTAYAIPL